MSREEDQLRLPVMDTYEEAITKLEEAISAGEAKITHMKETLQRMKELSIPKSTEGSPSIRDILYRPKRVEQAESFLDENGPCTQREIHEGTGIPWGSMTYVLNHDRFVQREDGKWGLKSELEELGIEIE